VRVFQPVHGYFVRRELLSWRTEAWAHLNPGSIYNGLRVLARDGFLEEVGTEAKGGRPARTSYLLTADGETEFLTLLRGMLWNVSPTEPDNLLAAWSFSWALSREEVIAAFEHRLEAIDASGRANEYAIVDLAHDPEKPSHVAESFRLVQARLEGEASWTPEMIERLRAGEHHFAGDPAPALAWPLRCGRF
jgi:DNA-binding PadR family transcriptional regulator